MVTPEHSLIFSRSKSQHPSWHASILCYHDNKTDENGLQCREPIFINSERLNEFRKQSLLTDVEFCVQGQRFACHQAVLACFSPIFNSVLTSDAHKHKIREGFAVLNANTVKDLLDFMYTGQVTITMYNVEQLLKVSNELKFEELATGCAEFQELYNASDCPDKAVYTLPTSCKGNELASGPKMQQHTSEADQIVVDTRQRLKCGSNIDASKLLKYANDEDRNITVGSDDADVFDSDSDGNDEDDDLYEEDTANEETDMSNVNTETDIRENECKIENEDQNGAVVPELFTGRNCVVICGNKGSSNMAYVEKPMNSASVNQPHLFETGNSVADMNVSGNHIKDDSSLSGRHTLTLVTILIMLMLWPKKPHFKQTRMNMLKRKSQRSSK
ncbi:myoneurin-like [Ptychodera flava]|uniref:myoneurin-like n=1 Tax=Ptychodera flava TaxID=63121 RepID=UPI00396A83FF